MLQGVDVHAGYGRIAWEAASKVVAFCWAKCTTGNDSGKDAQFAANVSGCKDNGVPVGGYHFAYPLPKSDEVDEHGKPAHPGREPEEQADRAFLESGGLGSLEGELPHMLDAEWPSPQDAGPKWGCTRPQISDWLRRYCERWKSRAGRRCIIYTYGDYWRWLAAGADVSWASDYDVVFADYGWPGRGTPPDGWEPPHWGWVKGKPWDDWTVCQYSAEGSRERIPGIACSPIDRDCVRDQETLDRLLAADY